MFRRALLLLSLAGLYILVKNNGRNFGRSPLDEKAEADWANEGGAV